MEIAIDNSRLWKQFWQGDSTARQELILAYLPLVKRVVGRLSINLPMFIDRGDLEGAAVLGLIDAITSFQPNRGVKFETYAVARVRGAALDSLRNLDFVPRSVRHKARQVQAVLQTLIASLGRQPEAAEIAQALGIGEHELDRWWQELQSVTIFSLDAPLDQEADSQTGLDLLAASSDEEPLTQLLSTERVQELAAAIDQLSQREQQVLSLYYQQGLTLRELGRVLSVSESRACQIHTAAILKLRARLTSQEVKKSGGTAVG